MPGSQATPNKRRGLRRLECDCGAAIYATWAQLERHGVPVCSCGQRFLPDDVELAMALGLEDAPVVTEYHAAVASVMHGQAGPARSLRATGKTFRAPEAIAAERLEKARRDRAHGNRLNALRPAVAEPIPF